MALASYGLSARLRVRNDCSPICVPKNQARGATAWSRRTRRRAGGRRAPERVPLRGADHDAVVARAVIARRGHLVEADGLHDGREREHGERQQDQRDAGQEGTRLAPPHVGDAQVERGDRDGYAPDVGLVDAARRSGSSASAALRTCRRSGRSRCTTARSMMNASSTMIGLHRDVEGRVDVAEDR